MAPLWPFVGRRSLSTTYGIIAGQKSRSKEEGSLMTTQSKERQDDALLTTTIPWIGGKHFSATRIRQAFPLSEEYDVYVELFGGGASVMAGLAPDHHVEVYNDLNEDLVNWWIQTRDHPEQMQTLLDTLPYSRMLYETYHTSLFDGSPLEPIERAVRWYYVLRGSYVVTVRQSRNGWSSGRGGERVKTYRNAIALFPKVAARFRYVQIECRDFADVLRQYESSRTLFYVDPPYIGHEHYYRGPGRKAFDWHDHERLADLLNATPAKVALSYYPHPQLEVWYPSSRWQRREWQTIKHAQRSRPTHDRVQEILLTNYGESQKQPHEKDEHIPHRAA